MSAPIIAPGATIFVTGANGLIGSYVIDVLLQKGYHVRGAVRDVGKSAWLLDHFKDKHATDAKLELVCVPDMTIEDCYDEFVKDTAGIIHIASPLNGPSAASTVPIGVRSATAVLTAATKTPSIKRVVYTSSSIAASFPCYTAPNHLGPASWNEEGIEKAWHHPADEDDSKKGLYVYAALKASSEKACWAYMEEQAQAGGASFTLNTVLPNVNFSRVLVPQAQGAPSTIEWARYAWRGGPQFAGIAKVITPQWFVSTRDTALLHVGALLHPDVQGERIFGYAERWGFNDLLRMYRECFPEREFHEDVEGEVGDMCVPPRERAEEVLGWVKGGEGWDGLREMVVEMAGQFASGEL